MFQSVLSRNSRLVTCVFASWDSWCYRFVPESSGSVHTHAYLQLPSRTRGFQMITTTVFNDELIHITSDISIKVRKTRNGRVSIQVNAPKSVPVFRCNAADFRENVTMTQSVLGVGTDRKFELRIVRDD
ncbi:carbon storage regulator [Planctomicrobium sp. SH668]|uniref:carbon storage regulator n=1 Tax=Planctomicrobium sp. SH668 TaxID=3448126 RepID=UPI003F5B523A